VICFFGLGFIGWISGFLPFTCCKRALLGAGIAYVAAGLAVKTVNTILTGAMINSRITRHLKRGDQNKRA
jgi:hypothetical protein